VEEFFEILTWGQLALHRKPCGLLNVRGYFDQLLSFVRHSIEEGFVRREYRSMISVSSSPSALIDMLAAYEAPMVEKWIEPAAT
jgi:predicted Rossmann-fold nucleotide-binding protein